ncbi:MAG: molybdopterin-dependent oxidoreductase, partial [Chloroflexi bacterium]|nr:molybdopterin-dependent oxidoreductase [Chloroflexota bacterium]
MGLTRRRFLQWAGATGIGAVVFNGCRVPDHEIQVQSPVQIPEDLVTGRDNYYATVIQGPSSSEGLLVRVMEGRAKKVEGNPDYPMNTGKHGLRAEALLQAAYHPDRIKTPLRRVAKGGPYRPIGWPEAIGELTRVLTEADPSRVVLATAPIRGVLADVTHRFADSYGARLIGFDPLDQTVLRAAMKRVFGQDALPDFDIARTGYLLSFGSDFLGTWLDPTHFARGYGEFRQGDGERGYLVQVDSRFSPTAAAADQWVYVTPGSEGLLAMAMIHTIVSDGLGDGAAASVLTGGRG